MRFSVQLTEYEACGRCGHTWPREGNVSDLPVTLNDLARAITVNNITRFIGEPESRMPLRERTLLGSNLLRVRAVVSGWRGPLMGHSIMDAHHGSARRNLSEDFGIAMAMSFLSNVYSCQKHYNLDAVKNKQEFGISSGKRPDIGSVTHTGQHVLTEAKGRKNLRELTPKPLHIEPAKLIRDSYQQVTSRGEAHFSTPTRLFLCVTSPIAAGRAVQLDAAEYVTGPPHGCHRCKCMSPPDDEDSRFPMFPIFETDWNALESAWYQRFAMLVGGTEADLDQSSEYHVHELAGADVTIGLHRRITELASNPDASLGRRLSDTLEDLAEEIDVVDDDRYSDGTLIRVNWPEMESDDEDDADTMQ